MIGEPLRSSSLFVHRVRCACLASANCLSFLMWEDNIPSDDLPDVRLLELNGWRLNHGRWICGLPHVKV